MNRRNSLGHDIFDGVNPAFALTVRMKSCRRILVFTAVFYVIAVLVILSMTLLPEGGGLGLSSTDFFEIAFLVATSCSLVFLGSDFGAMFLESTFQDELFRLTPLTPLGIVHGGMLSSLFFSVPLLFLALLFLPVAHFLGLPVERVFWGVLLLFLAGQMLNAVLLSSYITAESWRQIGFGAVTTFLLILSFVGFCFTRLGMMLVDTRRWPFPMFFLFFVIVVTFAIAYLLARSHATTKNRSFRQTVVINFCIFFPFWSVVCAIAVFLPC